MKRLLASTTLALGLGLGLYPGDPAVAQQVQFACDENDDGFVDATESGLCTDAEFDEIAKGEDVLTEEQLLAMTKGRQGVPPTFSEIDENGDGQISRDEWAGFSGDRFAGATAAAGGRMPAEDYEGWWRQGMQE
jgi:hypothetical protein